MAITPFTKDERPTMEAFNERFAQVLTDETAEYYGMGGEATPDDVFRAIAASVRASIVVTADTGLTVTGVSTVGVTATFREVAEGTYRAYVSAGTWTVATESGGITLSKTVEVEEVKQYDVNLTISNTLNDNDWNMISSVSRAGTGDTYWDLGDRKEITLNGTIGTKSYSNVKLCVFILHFNMPVNKTEEDNNIIWGGFKTALTGGFDVALDDSKYGNGSLDGTKYFNMNHSGVQDGPRTTAGYYCTNYGGWKGTDLRYDILGATEKQPSMYNQNKTTSNVGYDATTAAIASPLANTLMATLPSDFRAALRLWTRYVDNKGNSSNVDANVTSCVDAGISLLTEFEVFGTRTYANQFEQNHQVQCAYYTNGNSKVKYRQSSTGTSANWWGSSAVYNSTYFFSFAHNGGYVSNSGAHMTYGLAPAFKT